MANGPKCLVIHANRIQNIYTEKKAILKENNQQSKRQTETKG